jgi:hypothetical protein
MYCLHSLADKRRRRLTQRYASNLCSRCNHSQPWHIYFFMLHNSKPNSKMQLMVQPTATASDNCTKNSNDVFFNEKLFAIKFCSPATTSICISFFTIWFLKRTVTMRRKSILDAAVSTLKRIWRSVSVTLNPSSGYYDKNRLEEWLTLLNPVVTICTTCFNNQQLFILNLCVSYYSHFKQRLFP